MMTSTIDLKHWTKPLVVLKEKFHLSFPWVFTDAGKVYMVPETGTDGSIRVYEATDDTLTRWKLKRKLIEYGLLRFINLQKRWYLLFNDYRSI